MATRLPPDEIRVEPRPLELGLVLDALEVPGVPVALGSVDVLLELGSVLAPVALELLLPGAPAAELLSDRMTN
jgi:hypothetical protein